MDAATRVQYFLKTRVILANGSFAGTGAETAALGRTALVVTGRSAMRQAGATDKLLRQLEAAGVRPVLFEQVPPNPTTDVVDAGVALVLREKAQVVLGLGGGSALDTAKAIAAVARDGRRTVEYFNDPPREPAGLPIVAVPTTSGTGAEVTPVVVLTDPAERRKFGASSPAFGAAVAIVDPELTLTMPPEITAGSGMDALAHAVESYLSKNADAFSELFAVEATALTFRHLRAACANGADPDARTGMAAASVMAGITLAQAGVIHAHGFGMAIGGQFGTDHGTTVGLLLADILEDVRPYLTPRLASLAKRAGLAREAANDAEAADRLIEGVRRLVGELPLPASLKALGVDPAQIPLLVQGTLKQRSLKNLPQMPSEAQVEALLRKVLK